MENCWSGSYVCQKSIAFAITFMLTDCRLRCLSDNIRGWVQEIMEMKFGSQVGQFEFYCTEMSL